MKDKGNSPALQGYLNPEPESKLVYSEPQEFDVTCPAIPNNRPNAFRSSCVTRLTAVKVESCCRGCEEGQKIAQELNLAYSAVERKVCSSTSCRKLATPGYSTCTFHRTVARERYVSKRGNGVCDRCGEITNTPMKKFCIPCRDIVDVEINDRKNMLRRQKNARRSGGEATGKSKEVVKNAC